MPDADGQNHRFQGICLILSCCRSDLDILRGEHPYFYCQESMQKFYIEKLRFYVSGENLFTITGYDGIDPEFSRASVLNTGVDKLIYPFTRSFTVGAQLTF